MADRDELAALRRMAELESRSSAAPPQETSQTLGLGRAVGNFLANATQPAISIGEAVGIPMGWAKDSQKILRNPPNPTNAKPGAIGEFVGSIPGYVAGGLAGGPFTGGAIGAGLNSRSDSLPGVAADMALGGVLGKGSDMVMAGAQKLIAPQLAPAVQKLMAAKIPLTPGQTLGGMAKNFEDKAVSIPILGNLISRGQKNATEGFNTAVLNDALKPIGKMLPAGKSSGREAIDHVAKTIGAEYDALLPKMTGTLDAQLQQEVNTIGQNAIGEGATKDIVDRFQNVIKAQLLARAPNGTLNGAQLKMAQEQLNKVGSNFASSADGNDRLLGSMILDANESFNNMLLRNNPQYADALKSANAAWAKYSRIRRAGSALGNADGVFTAAQYSNAVKALDKSVDKGNYARGKALNQDLADAAKEVLPNSVPNSGTSDRAMAAALPALLTGAVPFAPNLAVPALAASALYTRPGQAAMRGLLGGPRPAWAPAAANAVGRARLPLSLLASSVPTLSVSND